MRFEIDEKNGLPSIQTDAYRLLVRGKFAPDGLRLHVQGKRKSYPPELREFIEQTWREVQDDAEKNGRKIYNERLFSLLMYQVRHGVLNLLLGETDYKELTGTNFSIQEWTGSRDEKLLSDGVAICSTIITEDGFLILGRRSREVHRGRGKLHVCAGHPVPDHVLTPERMLAGENLLFAEMKREIMEEFHIPADHVAGMVCLGLIRSRLSRKPEVLFQTFVKVPRKKVLVLYDAAEDKGEHQDIFFVPSEQAPLIDFLKTYYREFTSPGLAAVVFHGTEQGFWTQSP